jgi:hypothetical protein
MQACRWERPAPFETDEELLSYCDAHCRTDVALFHVSQIARICAIAGIDLDPHWPNWRSVGAETMLPLLERARARLASLTSKGTT